MKKIAIFSVVMSLGFAATPALAKSFVWGDPDYGFTVTYPDHWEAQGGLSPEQELRLLAPQSKAQCAFEAMEDRRFVIYPRRFDKEILSKEFNWTYWEDVTSNYNDRFFHFDKMGSLGRGDARYTVVDYVTDKGAKRELIYASIYGDMQFVARCATAQHLYDDLHEEFMSMIGSVDFSPAYSAFNNGYYRNFMGNGYEKPKKPNFFTKLLPYKKIRPIYTAQ